MCGFILGLQIVIYQFLGHCHIDLFSRIIVSGAYLLYYLRLESQISCGDSYWDGGVVHTILGHFDIDNDF